MGAPTPSLAPATIIITPPDVASVRYVVSDQLQERFSAFLRDSHSYPRRVSPATLKWYRDTFRTFLKYVALRQVGEITPETAPQVIRDWIAASLDGTHGAGKKGISPFTAKSYWQALRAFFVYLEKVDRFPNPFQIVEPPDLPDVLPKALDHEACIRVIAAARNTDWPTRYERARAVAMIAMALYAGLRRKEILSVEFDNVKIPQRQIVVLHGKGRHGDKQRMAYMNDELAAILEEYVAARRDAGLESVEFFTAMVPCRGGGPAAAALRKLPAEQRQGHGVKVKTFNRIVARVRATAGLRFSLHSLRHSFVSLLARDPDVSPQLLKELAGHRDFKTTERYLRLFDPDKLRAVGKLSFMPHPPAGDQR